jgi:hypothetical protein
LVPGTYHVFGNNGTTAYLSTVNSGSNTALTNLVPGATISAAQLLFDLTDASDHLPVVADYTIPIPAPRITSVNRAGSNLILTATNGITNGVYTVLMSTNIGAAFTNWNAVATNIASSGTFTLTATNGVDVTAPQRFFILRGK